MGQLSGRVAVISGGNRGLGKAMALALGKAGASVVLVARDESKLQEAVEELKQAGAEASSIAVDVTDEAGVAGMRDAVIGRHGVAHILINNAGINIRKAVADFALEEWNRVIGTNLTSAFLMSRAFIPVMREAKWGRIINMTSIMSHVSLAERGAYSASKAGLLGLTKAMALELAGYGITVTAISPGPFATEMNRPLIEDEEKNRVFLSKIPAGAWGQVEDIGELARFLCSDSAKFITGSDILIDGGWCAQ